MTSRRVEQPYCLYFLEPMLSLNRGLLLPHLNQSPHNIAPWYAISFAQQELQGIYRNKIQPIEERYLFRTDVCNLNINDFPQNNLHLGTFILDVRLTSILTCRQTFTRQVSCSFLDNILLARHPLFRK